MKWHTMVFTVPAVTALVMAGIGFPGVAGAGSPAGEAKGLRFPHPLHIEQELECRTCHAGVEESVSALDRFRPDHDVCGDCHSEVEEESGCGFCHTNPEDPAGNPPRRVVAENFSHRAHVSRGMDCRQCHGDLATAQPRFPAKAECRGCHATASDYQDCRVCHGPTEPMRPISHVVDYLSFHGVEAATDQTTCENCHAQTDCQDCHSGDNVRPRTHGLNFTFDHAISARGNEIECAVCHEETGFCVSCHVAEQVLPRSHSRGDWLVLTPDGGRHAEEARFNLEGCIACHDVDGGDPVCADCHGGD